MIDGGKRDCSFPDRSGNPPILNLYWWMAALVMGILVMPALLTVWELLSMAAGTSDYVEAFFRRSLSLSAFTERQWTISARALAKVQWKNADYENCVATWAQLASNGNVESKFRLCARLFWSEALAEIGDTQQAEAKYGEIEALMPRSFSMTKVPVFWTVCCT